MIERDIPDLGTTTFFTNSENSTVHQDNPFPTVQPNPLYYAPTYEVTALYAGGSSPPSQVSLYAFDGGGSAFLVRGPQGGTYLVASAIPQTATNTSIKITRVFYDIFQGPIITGL